MKKPWYSLAALLLPLALTECSAGFASGYDVRDYEEPAGLSFGFDFNPADDIYGLHAGNGTRIPETWLVGEYFFSLFSNGIEEGFYGGFGLSLRLMPRRRVAPFIGGGGSYNQILSRSNDTATPLNELAESYFDGMAETGVRFNGTRYFYEAQVSYHWSSSDKENADYPLARIGMGIHF